MSKPGKELWLAVSMLVLLLMGSARSEAIFMHLGTGCGDGGNEFEMIASPRQMVFSGGRRLWADGHCYSIRAATPGGIVQKLAQTTPPINRPIGVARDAATGAVYYSVGGNAFESAGNLLFVIEGGTVRPLPNDGIVAAGQLAVCGGALYVADKDPSSARGGVFRLPIPCDDCTPQRVLGGDVAWSPGGLACGPDGSLYVSSTPGAKVLRRSPAGVVTTVAGTGVRGSAGDGGLATAAQLNFPASLAVGADGSLYIVDSGNNRVRRVSPQGIISTLLGTGTVGNRVPVPGVDQPETFAVGALQGVAIDDFGQTLHVGTTAPAGIFLLDVPAAPSPATHTATAVPTATMPRTATPTVTRTAVPPTMTATRTPTRTPTHLPTCGPTATPQRDCV